MWTIPGHPPTPVDECPTSLITQESLVAVRDFWVSKILKQAPLAGGYYSWPATLVDAWVVLQKELDAWQEIERERRARSNRPGCR